MHPMAPLDRHVEPAPAPGDQATAALAHDLAPAELAAWRGMLRVHAALEKQLDAELTAEHDLPLSSYEVLITLQASPGKRCRMAELADRVLLSRSGLTRLIDRLAAEGLVRREPSPDDARGTFTVLTAEGMARLRAAAPVHLSGISKHWLAHFSDDELGALGVLLERVAEAGG